MAAARIVPFNDARGLGADGTLTSTTLRPRLFPVTMARDPLTATWSP